MAARDMYGIGSRILHPAGKLTRFLDVHALGEIIVAVQAENHAEIRRPLAHPACHLNRKTGAVFQRTAELIAAPVFTGRQKLRDQIAVCAMNFDHVEPGALSTQRRRTEGLDGLFDPIDRHLLGDDNLGMAFLNRVRDGRGRQRRLSRDVAPCMPSAMAELIETAAPALCNSSTSRVRPGRNLSSYIPSSK